MEYRPLDVLISEDEIHNRLQELAREIAKDCSGVIMVVALLKGSFVFCADLIRALHREGVRAEMDFMTLSSYNSGTESSGKVVMKTPLSEEVKDKDILIVDDILESGRTLLFAKEELQRRGAKSAKIAVLLDKPGKLVVDMKAEYVGFTIPDKFVVGYGLDYANFYRELPFIGVVKDA